MDKILAPIKTRIEEYLKNQGIIKSDFYKLTSIAPSNFKSTGKYSELGGDKVAKILSSYKNINPEWLMTGKGDMLRTDSTAVPSVPGKGIPLIPTDAIAGYGTPAFDDMKIEEYYYVREFKQADFLIRIKGNSMYPKYSSGDIVACKLVKERLFFQWNKIYAIHTDSQGVMVKRVQQSAKKENITLVSDNEKYKPFDVPLSDVIAVALVIGVISVE